MSPELKSDFELLRKMTNELTPEERKAPVNRLTTVRQVVVCGFAMACALRAIVEHDPTQLHERNVK